tara:strand:- start:2509 stop:2637 length:129 start_codon:yes stop_codon:yes gene_type:complete
MTESIKEIEDIQQEINQDIKEQKSVGKTASILMKQIRRDNEK